MSHTKHMGRYYWDSNVDLLLQNSKARSRYYH